MLWQNEMADDDVWTAGSRAPAGRYQRIDVAFPRTVILDAEDYLPASLDGRVALYRRLPGQMPAIARANRLPISA